MLLLRERSFTVAARFFIMRHDTEPRALASVLDDRVCFKQLGLCSYSGNTPLQSRLGIAARFFIVRRDTEPRALASVLDDRVCFKQLGLCSYSGNAPLQSRLGF